MAIKKLWYDILAPKQFGEKKIGESLAAEPKQLIGRVVKVALSDLGDEFQKFYLKLVLKVVDVAGTQAKTEIIGHDCMYERIYRMVQRRVRRVDCIQDIKTKDGRKLRVKTVLIIPRRVGTSIKDSVRAKLKEVVGRDVSALSFDEFINAVIGDKLQQSVRAECKKLYPIGQVEVRKSEVLA
jgi:small subunit ribosomal protein S3Ae